MEPSAPYAMPQTASVEWAQILASAGIAVLVAVFLIVIGMPAGFGMVFAGFLSVVLYRRRNPGVHLTAGRGARLGAITGMLGFGALSVMVALVTAFRSGKEVHDSLLHAIQQYAAHSADPRMQQVLDLFNTPQGFTLIMILSFAMTFVAFLIFSSLGGALGAFLLHRKERR
jgi:hypothetical protein